MKNFTLILGILVITLFSCSNGTETKEQNSNLVQSQINIGGMTCEGCEKAITANIEMLDAKVVDISYEEGFAVVEYDSAKVSLDQINSRIVNTGYNVLDSELKKD